MLQRRGHEFPPPPQPASASTGAVIRRLLRDYVSGEWGLLVLADLLHAARLGHERPGAPGW